MPMVQSAELPGIGPRWFHELCLAFGLAAGLVVLMAWRTIALTPEHADFSRPYDHHKYILMSRLPPGDFHLAPYCWRIGAPYVVRLLPAPETTGFWLVSTAGLIGTAVGMYLLSRQLGFDRAASTFALMMSLGTSWLSRFCLYDFWLPDAMASCFVVATVALAVAERWVAAACVMALGVTFKENVVFAAPLLATLPAIRRAGRFGTAEHAATGCWWPVPGDWLRAAAVSAPAVVVLVALRLMIDARSGQAEYMSTLPPEMLNPQDSSYDYLQLAGKFWAARVRDVSLASLHAMSIGALGVGHVAFSVAGLIRAPRFFWAVLPFFALCYLQLLFASDTQRLLAFGAPAMALMAAQGMQWLAGLFHTPRGWFLLVPGVLITLDAAWPDRVAAPTRWQLAALAVVLPVLWVVGAACRHRQDVNAGAHD